MKHVSIALASFALIAPAATYGQSLGPSSDQSFSVQVTIPPIAESLRAAKAGAVGLWTIEGRNSGLMINLSDHVAPDANASLVIFNRQGTTAQTVHLLNAPGHLAPSVTKPSVAGGLVERWFDLGRLPRDTETVTVVIADI